MERPPPHSVDAIRAKRVGGKKVPKQNRKYHKINKKKKQDGYHGITQGFVWVARGFRGAFEALR
jgi:hypothetical protein